MAHRSRRRAWLVLAGGVLLALLSTALTPSTAATQTVVYVVQGLPGRSVSVAVDGRSVADGLAGGQVAGPFVVRSGTRTMTVTDGGRALVAGKVRLPPGSNSDVVLHLPASPTGEPLLTRFDNRLRSVQQGRGAFAVAHVAAAGPIDIRIDKKVAFANVAVGEYLYKVVPGMAYSVDFVATGTSKVLLGPVDLMVEPAMLTWVFAIGEPGKDLAVLRHVIALSDDQGSSRPTEVDTGTGGQAAELAARARR